MKKKKRKMIIQKEANKVTVTAKTNKKIMQSILKLQFDITVNDDDDISSDISSEHTVSESSE